MKRVAWVLMAGALLGGCSKSPEEAAKGPDNAFTRYGENLAHSEQRAQDVANQANAAIAAQQKQMDQEAGQN